MLTSWCNELQLHVIAICLMEKHRRQAAFSYRATGHYPQSMTTNATATCLFCCLPVLQLKLCGGCHVALYCSLSCQERHGAAHAVLCKQLARARQVSGRARKVVKARCKLLLLLPLLLLHNLC
jgi:hypothetical protein